MVSAIVSLTLTPMMCSRFLRHDTGRHGRLYRVVEAVLRRRWSRSIGARWTSRCGYQFITLLVFLVTVVLTVVLYIYIPKGFFPPQDTGVVIGVTEGAQDVSFKEMSRIQQALDDVVPQDPDVRRLRRDRRRRHRRADGQ